MPGLYDPRMNSPVYRRRLQRFAAPREGLVIYQARFIWEASPEEPNRVENFIFGRVEPTRRDRVPQNLPVPRWRHARQPGPNAGQGPGQHEAQEEQHPLRQQQLIQQLSNQILGQRSVEEIDEDVDR